jgi:hypothetical protein
MNPATSSDSASKQIEGRTLGFGQRRNEHHHEHRKQNGERIPAMLLGVHDGGEIQRPGKQQHGDDDEADRDFVGYHLCGAAQGGEETVFRIRRPAAHDDAVDAERRDRE